jgi:hypothetical protein
VADDLAFLRRTYDLETFSLHDDTLTPRRLDALASALSRRDLDLRWSGFVRVDPSFTRDLYEKLHWAGCRNLAVGLESASSRILDLMGKGYGREDVVQSLCTMDGTGIRFRVNIILNFPTETYDEALETFRIMEDHADCYAELRVNEFWLSRKSSLYARPERFGIRLLPGPAEAIAPPTAPYEARWGMDAAEKEKILSLYRGLMARLKQRSAVNPRPRPRDRLYRLRAPLLARETPFSPPPGGSRGLSPGSAYYLYNPRRDSYCFLPTEIKGFLEQLAARKEAFGYREIGKTIRRGLAGEGKESATLPEGLIDGLLDKLWELDLMGPA